MHDTTSRYDAVEKLLTFLVVCRTCGIEQVVETLEYEPRPVWVARGAARGKNRDRRASHWEDMTTDGTISEPTPLPLRFPSSSAHALSDVRVLIADGQELVRAGFRALLEADGHIAAVGEAGARGATEQACRTQTIGAGVMNLRACSDRRRSAYRVRRTQKSLPGGDDRITAVLQHRSPTTLKEHR